jgi:hypothetical protein
MDTAVKFLVYGGMANLVYGFLTGFAFAKERSTKEFAPRYLVIVHVGQILQGTMLLALVAAQPFIHLGDTARIVSCALLAISTACFATKDTTNWLTGVTDEFKAKPTFQRILGAIGSLMNTVGLAILVVGLFL